MLWGLVKAGKGNDWHENKTQYLSDFFIPKANYHTGKMRFVRKSDIKLKKRRKTAHKGENGKVLIIGGSEDYVGTLALAGIAALRTGVDIVTVAAPEKPGWALHTFTPDLVVKKFKGEHFTLKHTKAVLGLAKTSDAVLIGNGIGRQSDSFVQKVVKGVKKPLVIDADGIKAVRLQDVRNAVITPHKVEFRMLLKSSRLKERGLRKNLGDNVILLKGPIDRIITRERVWYNKTGNEGLTVAGTGDVLAGLLVGFLAQRYSKFDSACWAAYINGKLGDLLKKKKGYAFIASDLLEDIRKVLGR